MIFQLKIKTLASLLFLAMLLSGCRSAAANSMKPQLEHLQVPATATTDAPVVFSTEVPSLPPGKLDAHRTVVLDGLIGPVGLAALADGTLLIAEEGTGDDDESAGVTILTPDGESGRLISGLPSSRDAGDLAGAHLVSVAPDGSTIYVGNFGQGHLWRYSLTATEQQTGIVIPPAALLPTDLTPALLPLNNVRLLNPFDMTYAADGRLIVSDASGNGVATANPDGTTRFIHRFDMLANPARASDPVEPVPTGITRVGSEYYVALFGGCPYPFASGQLVAIDEQRNQRTVVDKLNLPIDVARGPDGTIWVLEFAQFKPGSSCFDGSGYQPQTGRLSRLRPNGTLDPVLDGLDFPGAVLPMADGSLYLTEVFAGRVLHVTFGVRDAAVIPEPSALNDLAIPIPITRPVTLTTAVGAADRTLHFADVATAVGLDFRHGAFQTMPSMDPAAAMGAGLCWIDYDNDGWLDLYLVNSYALEEEADWATSGGLPRNALYRNTGGQFVDVSAAAGIDAAIRGNGCVAADLNLDGWLDLFVTVDGPNLLFWNNGDGSFTEGGITAGIAAPEWNSAAVVGDLNGDMLPDLFVAAYIDLAKMIPKPSGAFPQDFLGLPDRLYLNQGINPSTGFAQFREVTVAAGLTREERGLGALLSDVDGDRDLDLYIANDGHPNRLYANVPWPGGILADPERLGFRFEDRTAAADVGDSGSGMGVTGGDYDGDALTDLLITNWDVELNALYSNRTAAVDQLDFQYATFRLGMAGFGANLTGWGVQMADFDHDGDDDFLIANGHVPITDFTADAQLIHYYRNRNRELAANPSDRIGPPLLFRNDTANVGLEAVGMRMARGSAAADYDNDGDLDVAINTIGREMVLLQNNAADAKLGNWLTVDPGFKPGVRVTVTLADGRTLTREQYVGSSYLASEDPRLHFGLGQSGIAAVTIYWPDGEIQRVTAVAENQQIDVKE